MDEYDYAGEYEACFYEPENDYNTWEENQVYEDIAHERRAMEAEWEAEARAIEAEEQEEARSFIQDEGWSA